jgi:hypothetical protein
MVKKGDKVKVNMKLVKDHCDLKPYLNLVRKSIYNGLATVQGVSLDCSEIDIGNLLGSVWIPYKSIK